MVRECMWMGMLDQRPSQVHCQYFNANKLFLTVEAVFVSKLLPFLEQGVETKNAQLVTLDPQ